MDVVTPLGDGVLVFHRMTAREELSRLSVFEIDLLSENGDIDANKILGQKVTVKFQLSDGSHRCFNGFVTRFQQSGTQGKRHSYHASVRPWLWFLTRTADCRIFQDKTVPEIIKQVFADHKVADVRDALNSHQPFQPQRATPRPVMQGPQTAVVVGPPGEDIFTDQFGRVKVHFHWDRYGQKNGLSSCWVRPSHPLAGKNWGIVMIPRIGQEVIVDFLEGDPDQPIVTGRVYNADQMPPWELPANKTQTGLLTRSIPGGSAANANAIRFEDKKGSEQLWLHAEKNQDIEVENDETHWVGHDRSQTVDYDETLHVKQDRTETVDHNQTISIGSNRSLTVGQSETHAVGAAQVITIGATGGGCGRGPNGVCWHVTNRDCGCFAVHQCGGQPKRGGGRRTEQRRGQDAQHHSGHRRNTESRQKPHHRRRRLRHHQDRRRQHRDEKRRHDPDQRQEHQHRRRGQDQRQGERRSGDEGLEDFAELGDWGTGPVLQCSGHRTFIALPLTH